MQYVKGFRGLAMKANPVFAAAAVLVPVTALILSLSLGGVQSLKYVHVLTGVLWTGIDVFMGFVVGPVIGGLTPEERASVFRRLTPKMTFLMPTLAAVTITGGNYLAMDVGVFTFSNTWFLAAVALATLLSIQGFGVILPNEIRVYNEIVSESPDVDRIGRLGLWNARLGGVQGVLQILIVFVMVNI